MKYCIDTSSLIHFWNEAYPKETFPSLYLKLKEISNKIILIDPIIEQIKEEEELLEWINNTNIIKEELTLNHEKKVLELSSKYEVNDDRRGVDMTDIKIIIFSKIEGHILVTEEGKQNKKPKKRSSYKIPLVCKEEGIDCINSIEFIQRNKIRI